MKSLKFSLYLSIIFFLAFSSCNSEDDIDDTPTIERIVGEWNATEVANGQTTEFTMSISQADGEIRFVDNRIPPPIHTLQTFSYPFDEETDTFSLGTVGGTVESDNRITADYAFGTATSIIQVSLVLTR